MGFLDNSGDIILDAVLTDLGRERLARGDGSFKITKFAVADDEIDYGKYNKDNLSGSAYYDLDILTTPVLEAFTNNIGSVKHKLMTIPRNNLLYLPVIKLVADDTIVDGTALWTGTATPAATNLYMVSVDTDTSTLVSDVPPAAAWLTQKKLYKEDGVIRGDGSAGSANGNNLTSIVLDQGLDTTQIPNTFVLDADLVENQYIIEIDDRLGKITQQNATTLANVNFIDDDRIASYYLSKNTNPAFFPALAPATLQDSDSSALSGPRGTRLRFAIRASLELNTSQSLFDRLGSTMTLADYSGKTFKYIDSTVRITGVTTGYRVDIPIRFIKYVS